MSDPLALPFDQYQRYRLVADLLRQLRADGPPLRVLDVGGRTAVLREFLPSEHITLVDMEASESTGLVLGDGSALPFADDAFDVVAAFDTLEHVPPPRRSAFVAECARVAKRWVVLCGPYQHERVVEAEELLQQFMAKKLGERHRYLDEHRHHGLPERATVERELAAAGARVASIGHGNLDRWLVLQCLSMYLDYDAALRALAREFQRFYNASLYASDHAEPVYRHVVVAAFDGAALPDASELLGPPRAPAGTLAPFAALTRALLDFDRERDAWRAERAVLKNESRVLLDDLGGHKTTLAELEREIEAQRATIAEQARILEEEKRGARATVETLERDLAGHKARIRELDGELLYERNAHGHTARQRDEIARLRAEHEKHVAAIEADLAGHRATLAAVEQDLAGHRASVAALTSDLAGHRATVENLGAELERARRAEREAHAELAAERARASALDEELRESLALANGLEKSLADREVVYDELRAQLRSRWANLRRVFRPKH